MSFMVISMLLSTVAHNCHSNNKYLTAKPKSSQQNKKAHGKAKKLTAKPKSSRQNKQAHGKTNKLMAKPRSSRQTKKAHGKTKKLTAKPNTRGRCCIHGSWTLIVRAKVFGVKSNMAASSSQIFLFKLWG